MDQRFPKEKRLRKTAEFRRVYEYRQSYSDPILIVYLFPNDREHSRLGLSVSRKIGNAVARNRWKRRLREVFRRLQNELPRGFDIVVLPRPGIAEPPFETLIRSFRNLVSRTARKIEKKNPV